MKKILLLIDCVITLLQLQAQQNYNWHEPKQAGGV